VPYVAQALEPRTVEGVAGRVIPVRAQQDGVGGRDGAPARGRERDQLAALVVGVWSAFDEAVGFQLEEDLASAAAEAESERFGELAPAVVGLDEPVHEGPGPLDGIG
jgi:hypothetical protein